MLTHQITNARAGGLLIGAAAAIYFWLNGRIAGISSVINNLLFSKERLWPALFILGVVAGAGFFYLLGGDVPKPRTDFPAWLLALGGLLVGFGTGLARGCTSGHGVCGLGQLSLRSLVATLTFLSTGLIATFIVRHLLGVL